MVRSRSVTRLEVQTQGEVQSLDIAPAQTPHSLADILRRAGMPLNTRCGQRGLCDGCVVELTAGTLLDRDGQQVSVNGEEVAVHACRHHPCPGAPATIAIPPRSALAYAPQVVSDFQLNVSAAHDPVWQQIPLAPAPTTAEQLLGLLALRHPQLPLRLACDFVDQPAFATLEHRVDHLAVTALSDAPHPRPLGAAVDVGTTTVAVLLVDLRTGKPLARCAGFNAQMRLGDDVLTRINLCAGGPDGLRQLQQAVGTQTLLPLLRDALRETGADFADLKAIVVAANTTMLHLLAGVDPTPMGVAPFTAPFLDHRLVDLADVADDAPSVPCHLLPGAAAYVGADLTAGALASALPYEPGPSLLVDVGTNGEIILQRGDELFGCATAAGPAFEGAGLCCGIRAGEGAISHIALSAPPFAVQVTQISADKRPPIGICGSGYIDFLAQGRRVGLLGATGRFELENLPDAAGYILTQPDGDLAFRVARGQGKRPIVITQRDLANLLPAKAAIAAGILILLKQLGLRPDEIRRVYLAGGFGTHMNAANAIDAGLLPGFRPDQIQPVGNTSLGGAYLALIDKNTIADIAKVARDIRIVELNLDPDFEGTFIDQLMLP